MPAAPGGGVPRGGRVNRRGMTNVIVITGPPAIGKTTVAYLLSQRLGGTVARISGDVFVLAVTPFETSEERRAFLRANLTSFARHAVGHAYDWVVIECVIPSGEFLRRFVAETELPAERHHIFALLAGREAYERRLRARLCECDTPATERQLRSCHEWLERIAGLREAVPIDTTSLSPERTAELILRHLATG